MNRIFLTASLCVLLTACTVQLPPKQEEPTEPQNKKVSMQQDMEQIRIVFAEKYPDAGTVELVIDMKTETHARGTVVLGEGPGNAGLFLATKIDGTWVVVFDGNGAVPCALSEQYSFPQDMMEGCR